MEVSRVQTLIVLLIALALAECNACGRQPRGDVKKITVTVVGSKSATITEQYHCGIKSHRHIEVRTPADGHLVAIPLKEGQAVKRGDLLFQVGPSAEVEKPDAENRDKTIPIKAPFDGLIGRLPRQCGSFVLKGETLTTLSDNSVMWAYFNVPEKRYFEDMAERGEDRRKPDLELILADHRKFPHAGKIGAIEAEFSSNTGNITFRADFPNPDGLLRHGQAGTLSINRVLKDAVLVPQRATFEEHAKRYVYVVDKDRIAHRREIVVQDETEDFFVVKKGIGKDDKIVLEGARQVFDGDKIE